MKKFFQNKKILLALGLAMVGCLWDGNSGVARAATVVSLGAADGFAVLAGGGIAVNSASLVVNGDFGNSPNGIKTGPSFTLNGTSHINDTTAASAQTDLTTAYTNADQTCTSDMTGQDLEGNTFTPGVYCWSSGAWGFSGTLTLNAQGNANAVFIIKTGTYLNTGSGFSIILANGAQASNVFWRIGSSATIGSNNTFKGNLITNTGITLNDGGTFEGRLLSKTGYLNLGANTITKATSAPTNAAPTSTSVTASSNSIKYGSAVTFTGNWTESDSGDNDKMYVCKNASCTSCNSTTQTGCYCSSSGNQIQPDTTDTCSYTSGIMDLGSHPYWLNVCDDEPSCSATFQYGGTFKVGLSASLQLISMNSSPKSTSLSGAVTSATSTATGLNAGLVGYWTMDGADINWTTNKIIDRSGNGNTGTLAGLTKTTGTANGKLGQALKFNGSTSYVSSSGFGDLGIANKPYSFSGWVMVPAGAPDGNIIHLSNQADGNNWCIPPVSYISGKIRGYSWGGGAVSTIGTTVLTANKWYHFTNTWDPIGGLKIYVNGQLENSTSQATYAANGNNNYVFLGFKPSTTCSGSTNFFTGKLDDVRVYNRALSVAEVKQLYNLGSLAVNASPAKPNPTGIDFGLTGWWTMDGKDINWTAKTMTDRSVSGATATMVGLTNTTSTIFGKIGQAFNFDGSAAYLNRGNYTTVQTAYTIAYWFKLPASGGGGTMLMRGDTSDAFYNPRVYLSGGNTIYVSESGVSSGGLIGSYALPLGVWHHLVITRSGNTAKVYINGELVTTDNSQPSPAGTASGKFVIGAGHNGTVANSFYTGQMDEFRLYNRALSATEVSQLYTLGKIIIRQ